MRTAGETRYGYCGPARLAWVAQKFNLPVTIDSLAEIMGTTPEKGTLPEQMVRAARQLGLKAYAGENSDLDQLESARQDGAEVIVDWLLPDGPEPDLKKDGHYSIFKKAADDWVSLVDPGAGIKGEDVVWYLTREEFMRRWSDVRPDNTKVYHQWAMKITG